MSLMSVTSSTAYTTTLTEFTSIAYCGSKYGLKKLFCNILLFNPKFYFLQKADNAIFNLCQNIPWGPLRIGVQPTTNKCALYMFIYKNTEFLQILSPRVQTTFHILAKFIPSLYWSKYMHEKLVRYIFLSTPILAKKKR